MTAASPFFFGLTAPPRRTEMMPLFMLWHMSAVRIAPEKPMSAPTVVRRDD